MQENECGQTRLPKGASIEQEDDPNAITNKENNASHLPIGIDPTTSMFVKILLF